MKWRLRLRSLHRDIGYLCVGLTLAYAISGVAVNHHDDWDHSFRRSHVEEPIGTPSALLGVSREGRSEGEIARAHQDALVAAILQALGREGPPRNAFWRGPQRFSVFLAVAEKDVIDYDPERGVAAHTALEPRVLLRDLNFLHLNEGKGVWTWLADLFAVLLAFLALSGIFLVKGRKGLRGRGGVLLAVGLLVPVLYLLLR